MPQPQDEGRQLALPALLSSPRRTASDRVDVAILRLGIKCIGRNSPKGGLALTVEAAPQRRPVNVTKSFSPPVNRMAQAFSINSPV
jgi:hypothetical protein